MFACLLVCLLARLLARLLLDFLQRLQIDQLYQLAAFHFALASSFLLPILII